MVDTRIINDSIEFLVSHTRGKRCKYESAHPWRKGWEFVIQHSLRVKTYATKILNYENHKLTDREVELIKVASILHDIGRIDYREEHSKYGANLVRNWLIESYRDYFEKHEIDTIYKMIKNHSDKDGEESDFSSRVLKDADTLDEIGILSIFMASNWIDRESPIFFHELLGRTEGFEIEFCKNKMAKLYTKAAKDLLNEKMKFIETFNKQLKEEIAGTEDILSYINS